MLDSHAIRSYVCFEVYRKKKPRIGTKAQMKWYNSNRSVAEMEMEPGVSDIQFCALLITQNYYWKSFEENTYILKTRFTRGFLPWKSNLAKIVISNKMRVKKWKYEHCWIKMPNIDKSRDYVNVTFFPNLFSTNMFSLFFTSRNLLFWSRYMKLREVWKL